MAKKVKENELHQKKGQGKCASLNATAFFSYVIKNCVQLVSYATIYEQSNSLSLASSFSILCFRDRE